MATLGGREKEYCTFVLWSFLDGWKIMEFFLGLPFSPPSLSHSSLTFEKKGRGGRGPPHTHFGNTQKKAGQSYSLLLLFFFFLNKTFPEKVSSLSIKDSQTFFWGERDGSSSLVCPVAHLLRLFFLSLFLCDVSAASTTACLSFPPSLPSSPSLLRNQRRKEKKRIFLFRETLCFLFFPFLLPQKEEEEEAS